MTDLLPIALPAWLTPQLMTSALVIVVVLHVALGAAAYGIWLERKLSAWVQDRVGPNRVGPFGLLQPIADGLKLIAKNTGQKRFVIDRKAAENPDKQLSDWVVASYRDQEASADHPTPEPTPESPQGDAQPPKTP